MGTADKHGYILLLALVLFLVLIPSENLRAGASVNMAKRCARCGDLLVRCPKCGREVHQRSLLAHGAATLWSPFNPGFLGPAQTHDHSESGENFGRVADAASFDGGAHEAAALNRPVAFPSGDGQSAPMNPSGEGGNPSFTYSVAGYQQGKFRSFSSCQGTLTRKEGEWCAVVTAAHCLTSAEDLDKPQAPQSHWGEDIDPPDGKATKRVSLEAPGFGKFVGTAVLNPEYVQKNRITDVNRSPTGAIQVLATNAPNDIAMIFFNGPQCAQSKAMVAPLTQECSGNQFVVGSRWLKTTFPATVARSISPDRLKVTVQGRGTRQGDSGGGLFCRSDSGYQTVGVLSNGGTSEETDSEGYSPHPSYSGGTAMQWAMAAEKEHFGKQ